VPPPSSAASPCSSQPVASAAAETASKPGCGHLVHPGVESRPAASVRYEATVQWGTPRVLQCFVVALALPVIQPASAWAQQPSARPLVLPIEPITPTKIESLLATPNLVLVADYYNIDMRFGPNLRVDAVIVEAVDARRRLKGVRVQVRDPESRSRQDGTSFIDIEELTALSRAVAAMADLAARWTHDDRLATELTFTSAGGFRLAIRQSARVPRAYLSTGLADPVVTSIDVAELPTLKLAFDQALEVLNSK
jgi:hypothetical protein